MQNLVWLGVTAMVTDVVEVHPDHLFPCYTLLLFGCVLWLFVALLTYYVIPRARARASTSVIRY